MRIKYPEKEVAVLYLKPYSRAEMIKALAEFTRGKAGRSARQIVYECLKPVVTISGDYPERFARFYFKRS